jgi:hypothetical protein
LTYYVHSRDDADHPPRLVANNDHVLAEFGQQISCVNEISKLVDSIMPRTLSATVPQQIAYSSPSGSPAQN